MEPLKRLAVTDALKPGSAQNYVGAHIKLVRRPGRACAPRAAFGHGLTWPMGLLCPPRASRTPVQVTR